MIDAPDPVGQVADGFRSAIETAVPALAGAAMSILGQGWHSTAILAGTRVFKFPRGRAAEAALRREVALLAVIRPAVRMTVPDMLLHERPIFMTEHGLIAGEHLLATEYVGLSVPQRDRLAADLAGFHADLHAIGIARMEQAGAGPIERWLSADEVRRLALPLLNPDLAIQAAAIIDQFDGLPPDPLGEVYGFFDLHGWNMAFDHAAGRLNGVYDFGDSGFGPLHQEFIYSSMISPDLTSRLIAAYKTETGLRIDRTRVATLIGMHRLVEVAQSADDPEDLPAMLVAANRHLMDQVQDRTE